MITGEIRNKIDTIWDIFFSGGISNPLKVIEQINYLMFIHELSVQDDKQKRKYERMLKLGKNVTPFVSIFTNHENCKWSNLKSMSAEDKFANIKDNVFPFIKNLNENKDSAFSRYMANATFDISSMQKLESIINNIDELFNTMSNLENDEKKNADIKGDVYEYMLSKLGTSKDLGQFRTPRHIIRMMVELIKPTLEDTICDPACGTAGFLVEASKYLEEKFYDTETLDQKNSSKEYQYTGYDVDNTMLEIAAMNMMQHGIKDPNIKYKNSLTSQQNEQDSDDSKYSIVLANPPFKGSLEAGTISPELTDVVQTSKTELLFLAKFIKILKTGGKAAVIVPDGVLFGSSKAHKNIRKQIIEHQELKAVISLPSGVFKPYSGVSTSILIFYKTEKVQSDKVWFYELKADGYSLDDKRQKVEENDIPDVISRYENLEEEINRARTEQSFFVPKAEIINNEYDLSINKYKEVIYQQEELPPSSELIKELAILKEEYCKELDILSSMLKEDI